MEHILRADADQGDEAVDRGVGLGFLERADAPFRHGLPLDGDTRGVLKIPVIAGQMRPRGTDRRGILAPVKASSDRRVARADSPPDGAGAGAVDSLPV
ncbi:MAG: hypothetical protein KIT22_02195 [Verrucomicrobiae bacterium]|nr:hypothetical protein [Verrucomicrobiae bacterium]